MLVVSKPNHFSSEYIYEEVSYVSRRRLFREETTCTGALVERIIDDRRRSVRVIFKDTERVDKNGGGDSKDKRRSPSAIAVRTGIGSSFCVFQNNMPSIPALDVLAYAYSKFETSSSRRNVVGLDSPHCFG